MIGSKFCQAENKDTEIKRIGKSFMGLKKDIVDNDYNLSINKYKEIDEYPPASEIMANIREIEAEIAK